MLQPGVWRRRAEAELRMNRWLSELDRAPGVAAPLVGAGGAGTGRARRGDAGDLADRVGLAVDRQ